MTKQEKELEKRLLVQLKFYFVVFAIDPLNKFFPGTFDERVDDLETAKRMHDYILANLQGITMYQPCIYMYEKWEDYLSPETRELIWKCVNLLEQS